MIPRTVAWHRGAVRIIDQRALPGELQFLDCRTVAELADAISTMAVRGAPALGAAGAYGVALAETLPEAREAARRLVSTRPTAVNLTWGVGRALDAFERGGPDSARAEADAIADADAEGNRAIGRHGLDLVPDGARILTHCNAGGLATVEYGTALGVVRAAAEEGRIERVWVGETRPVLQGSRLTMWELDRLGIDGCLVADSATGSLMARSEVDLVIVGADRIAANGDVANKIGTYPLAVLARHHAVPFYVAAPTSTIDSSAADGDAVPIEERDPDEITSLGGASVAPAGARAHNPAFDITPAPLVSAIVTERGVFRPPFAFGTNL